MLRPSCLATRLAWRLFASLVTLVMLAGAGLRAAEGDFRARTNHWAFQFPTTAPAVPGVTDAWVRNDLDRFILQKLRSNGLAPSSEANRVTLIRRLTFNLHSLPPQPVEVAEFVKDTRPDAYERLVDRLLASPRYGERWARHWLDLVHYGESHGYDKDKPRANAWPYRDYVIRAFNRDIPYSRFVQQQIAGDVMFPDEPEGVVATGFIAAGPWDFVGHVELPESKRDGLIARYNDRDDMVMTTMSTFQSLTVHCARCHDHKFDPIATRDYYNLQAVFAGVDRADRWIDTDKATFSQRKTLLADKKQAEARLKQLDELVAKVSSPEIERLDTRLKEAKAQLAALPKNDKESPSNGYHSGIESKPDVTKWVQVDLVQNFDLEEVRLIPARPTDFPDTPGFGFPKRFRVEIADEDQFKQPRVIGDFTSADVPNPGDKAFVIPAKKQRGRFVRVTATRLWERTSDYVFALAELQIIAGTNNVAQWSVASALDSIEAGRWGKAKLVDAYDSRKRIGTEPEKPEIAAQRAELNERVTGITRERKALVEAGVPVAVRQELAALNTRLAATTNQLAALPKAQMVYAAANDFSPSGNFSPAKTPRAVHLLKRGDVKTPGEVSQPGSVDFLPGMEGQFKLPEGAPEGARRASLAQWITDKRNLLTRRSIVNRTWQYHFGRGLVDSPNDFGHMGSAPSHPELLDWLAFWFQAHGESLKDLHRLILTSATYRQRSDPAPNADPAIAAKAAGMDSDNRYLWRMNRTRLDAESFRDALLSLSGKLDLTMGGPSVQQFFFKDDHSPVYDYTRFDVDSPGANRRSIYRFIVRSVPDPLMDCLDSADPALLTARRNSTLTALQALASLNNPFVLRQCEHLAERVAKIAPTKAGQIGELYQIALHRQPSAEETREVGAYAEKHGLANACRLVINSNEFMFVD